MDENYTEWRTTLENRLSDIHQRIKVAAARGDRDADQVTLVAVTKTIARPVIDQAIALGVAVIGENRVQEADSKFLGMPPVERNLIGSLQTNKASRAIELFDVVHSLDRWDLAVALNRAADKAGRRLPVLVQVNVAAEASKHGVSSRRLPDFLRQVAELPALDLQGLMTVAPLVQDTEEVRPVFRELRNLRDHVQKDLPGSRLEHLSMGMTNDFEVAIEEGATLVRIGNGIFGPRLPTV